VREKGIELFAMTHSWSGIVVKGWEDRDGECALRLTVALSLRKIDYVIPVPSPERAALEEFLVARAVAGASAETERVDVQTITDLGRG
jgi:hypothetical protein